MQDGKIGKDKPTAFESTLEITTKEEMDRLVMAFEESLKGKNVPEQSPEEIEEFLRKSKENFRKRHNVKI